MPFHSERGREYCIFPLIVRRIDLSRSQAPKMAPWDPNNPQPNSILILDNCSTHNMEILEAIAEVFRARDVLRRSSRSSLTLFASQRLKLPSSRLTPPI